MFGVLAGQHSSKDRVVQIRRVTALAGIREGLKVNRNLCFSSPAAGEASRFDRPFSALLHAYAALILDSALAQIR